MPGPVHARREEVFALGSHAFNATEVCAAGRFAGRQVWKGPPRAHLEDRFVRWNEHLHAGIDIGASGDGTRAAGKGKKSIEFSRVQVRGGYQNLFIYAERGEPTPALWRAIAAARAKHSEPDTCVQEQKTYP